MMLSIPNRLASTRISAIAELACGLGLILDRRGAPAGIAALLVLFMAVLGWGLWLGLDIDCGCYGPGDPEATAFAGMRAALWRDGLMLAGVGCISLRRRAHARKSRPLPGLLGSLGGLPHTKSTQE